MGMREEQFASLKFKNGDVLHINKQYITSYAYLPKECKTVVTILGEPKEIFFPGNQIDKIIGGEEE